MKWIELWATFVHMQAKLDQENILMIKDESDDTALQTLDPRGLRPITLSFGHGASPQ